MSLIPGFVQRWAFGKWIGQKAEEARVGRLGAVPAAIWRALDGHKTVLWAVVVALKTAFPHLGFWTWVDIGAQAIGWRDVAPAVDPNQLVLFGTLAVALGHKVVKAWQQPAEASSK